MDRLSVYPIPVDLEKVLSNSSDPCLSQKSKLYQKVLKAMKNITSVDILEKHYLSFLKLGLYLEEHQSQVEIRKYELRGKIEKFQNAVLENPKSALYKICTDNIDEENPCIKPNDSVEITGTNNEVLFSLKITDVFQSEIEVVDESGSFTQQYEVDRIYHIKFRANNYTFRCCHYAIELLQKNNTIYYLFPSDSESYEQSMSKFETKEFNSMTFFNASIEENHEQKQAVLNITNKSSYPIPYILYGPPGTGKTATLVEAVCQIVQSSSPSSSQKFVLVCTPSNTAGDEITKRLLNYLDPNDIYRMYSQSKNGSTIDQEIKECSNFKGGSVQLPTTSTVRRKKVVITTLCNCTKLIFMNSFKYHFSHVIIDEAGQGVEADILIPIALISDSGRLRSQIVLAGDPKQLGPTVLSRIANALLGTSILERLMVYDIYKKDENNHYNSLCITKLVNNYRSLPEIIRIPNKLFYDDELIAKRSNKNKKFPVIFHGICGNEEKQSTSTSVYNYAEANLVVKYAYNFVGEEYGEFLPEDVGIITPFTLQSKKIKALLKKKKVKGVQVGTVELFQGQERNIIIMSTVRSKTFVTDGRKHIGFLSNPKRFNVALTRAKNQLIIIGNPYILQTDRKWRELLKLCIENKAYQGVDFKLDEAENNEISEIRKVVTSTDLLKLATGHESADSSNFLDQQRDEDEFAAIFSSLNLYS